MVGETNTGEDSRIRLGKEFRAVSGQLKGTSLGGKGSNKMAGGRDGETVPAELISQWKERIFKR